MSLPPPWDRVQDLFHEALELGAGARELLLAERGRAEPALVAEVRSLLAAHGEAGGFLDGSPGDAHARSPGPGERIGPYRILHEIGRGGMGIVFRATRDEGDFRKDVAIKLIAPGLRSDDLHKRFQSERQILALLDHPHIARLIDGGTTPEGAPYLVMDFVDGRSLLDDCDARQLTIDRRLALFLDVCDAVQFAHQRLVIHRDLKPDNILVTADGSPRLLDFGIARLVVPDADGSGMTVTAPMHRLLTPDYASPEQIRGEPVTVAGDVYSLGVILYELLSGQRPISFRTRAPEGILKEITERDPELPSVAVAHATAAAAAVRRGETIPRLRRRIAGDLDGIVMKALEKEPGRRYGSVEQFAADIRRHLEGKPVHARGHDTAYRMSRFVRRHRLAVISGSLVGLALVAGLLGTSWQAGVARRERDRANRRFEDVRALAQAMMYDVHDAIVDLPGSTKAREKVVDHALRYLNVLSGDARGDPALQRELGVAFSKIGDVQGRPMFPNLGRTREALDSYTRGVELLRLASDARPESLGYARDLLVVTQRLADLLFKMGRTAEAMESASGVRDRIRQELERHPDDASLPGDLILAHDRIGDMKFAAGDTLGAVAEREVCLRAAETIFMKFHQDPAARRSVLIHSCKSATLLAARGDRAAALTSYRRAESLGLQAVRDLGENTEALRDLSIVYGFLGIFLADGGEIDSALAVYERAMRICEGLASADSSNVLAQTDVASGHLQLGTILMAGGRSEEAERRFHAAYERYSRLVEADSADVESRVARARAGRLAGEACLGVAGTDRATAPRWRARARRWFEQSLPLYRALERAGALTGEEVEMPALVAGRLGDPNLRR